MATKIRKMKEEIPTIDTALITIQVGSDEFGFDTANKLSVEVQTEDTDAVKLVVKGILRAQKKAKKTVTGHTLTLSDNVFSPELVKILQGGTIERESDGTIKSYTPPVAGSADSGEKFTLNAYTAQYDAGGNIVRYEKISYPNCTGNPVALNSEDGAFRAPEYTIDSAPSNGEAPYSITYVTDLPELVDESELDPTP